MKKRKAMASQNFHCSIPPCIMLALYASIIPTKPQVPIPPPLAPHISLNAPVAMGPHIIEAIVGGMSS